MFAYIPHKIISSLLIDNILSGSSKTLAAKGYEDATIAEIFQRPLMLAEEYCIITFR
jgi:hypothetical protein